MALSEREERELLQLLEAEAMDRARQSYAAYVQYVHEGRWIAGRHLLLVCRYIEDVLAGRTRRLIIQMPPQHGKSMAVTETLPSYFLGRWPEKRVIEISYGDELAQVFGRRNRQKIERYGRPIFGIELAKNTRSETEFEIAGTAGGMISRGLGGSITGRAADLIIIDDPIKNRQEADSETYRARLWDEWLNTVSTRLSADGRVVLIQTRWHEDDLAGRLQREEPEKWRVLSLPCEAEDGDPLGRAIGEPLFPEIGKDAAWLAEFKRSYVSSEGARAWNALFQQRPAPVEGALIKREWWQYYDTLPEMETLLQSWDMTFKDSDGTDFVAGQVWGIRGGDAYLIDRVKKRLDFVATIAEFEAMTRRYPQAVIKLIEDKANGPAVISMLRHKIPGIIPVEPKGSKLARASAVTPMIESRNVYLPRYAPWVNEFVEECAAFPNGAHDDDVDAMSQALQRVMYIVGHDPEPEKRPDYDDDDDDDRPAQGYFD